MKFFRAVLSGLGTVYDILIPPRIEDRSRAQVSRGASPEAVSARPESTAAPASGHPTSAVPPAAVDDPGASSPLAPGSPATAFTLIRGSGGVEAGSREADEFSWQLWVIPAITKVIAKHVPSELFPDGPIFCARPNRTPCAECVDWEAWVDHVAPGVASGIHSAAAAQSGPARPTSPHRNGDYAALMFPQHTKPQK